MNRKNISSGAPWEDVVGYSRAVIVDNMIHIAGTTATGENGEIVGLNDPYLQTKHILNKIKSVLENSGSKMENVIRTRLFVTDISKWEEYGRAHGEFFKTIKPASTMVEISKLVDPNMMIEIEVDAYLGK